jgi:hypothetical protein
MAYRTKSGLIMKFEGIVSMLSGVFRPYAGVSTAVLIFTKGCNTKWVWSTTWRNPKMGIPLMIKGRLSMVRGHTRHH